MLWLLKIIAMVIGASVMAFVVLLACFLVFLNAVALREDREQRGGAHDGAGE